jgi:hypothetical protein
MVGTQVDGNGPQPIAELLAAGAQHVLLRNRLTAVTSQELTED